MDKTNTIFSTFHPVILFLYVLLAPISIMLGMHPVFTAVNLSVALAVYGFYFGARRCGKMAMGLLGVVLFVGTLNFCFNTRGMHVLFQVGRHPFTLESLLFGITSGCVLAAVILWFQCFNKILSNEKFLYLFSRRLPAIALLLSMILKLFPDTKYRMQSIRYADRESIKVKKPSFSQKISKGLVYISTLLEWSMEDSIEMADSMKARGYGEAKRSSYQQYRWSLSDSVLALFLLIGGGISIAAVIVYGRQMRWYPLLQVGGRLEIMVAICILYGTFLGLPIWLEMKGRWRRPW